MNVYIMKVFIWKCNLLGKQPQDNTNDDKHERHSNKNHYHGRINWSMTW